MKTQMSPTPSETLWHEICVQEILKQLHTRPLGLEEAEAKSRLGLYGLNVILEEKKQTSLAMFFSQFKDFMILVLLAAAVLSAIIGDPKNAMVIVAILALNAIIGFVQEYQAEKAVQALKKMAALTAVVLREGKSTQIEAGMLVPGDIVLLEAGRILPADLRLIESAQLRMDESALTGESVPIDKISEPLKVTANSPLADRVNMAYKGTVVTYGRGKGVVVATGMKTEVGKIAHLLEKSGTVQTPLQKRLAQLGKYLSVSALGIGSLVFFLGVLRGEEPLLMFMVAVSLAVAAIPEALPAVVSVSLALGAKKMAQKNALVRKLMAVETLGSVTVICTDKTGTLTLNQMRVEEFYVDHQFSRGLKNEGPGTLLLQAMALCNDALWDARGKAAGDPTEKALVESAKKYGIEKQELEKTFPRISEIPFDASRRLMTTVHQNPAGGVVSFTKGASESLLEVAEFVLDSAGLAAIQKNEWKTAAEKMAEQGLRVLALGMKDWMETPASLQSESVEKNLILLGLVGMMDPPREDAKAAVATCKQAGIVPVMITGDHPVTARAIACKLGISDGSPGQVMTGQELSEISLEDFGKKVREIRVYARVSPEQKLKIVTALQDQGEYVAMTGDGVNDAPALKRADIGVAMGVTGTDVAKEASSMILLDDRFATLVRAVQEGRRIYDNMRRFIRYAVATNAAEVWIVVLAPLIGLPLPFVPIQILWINLLTDGLPGLALAAERAERDVMVRKPRPTKESVFAQGLGFHVIWVGILMAALVLGSEAVLVKQGASNWQSFIFTLLCTAQLAHILAIRSESESIWSKGFFFNRPLWKAVALTFLLQMATLYLPLLNDLFKTQPLSFKEMTMVIALSSIIYFAVESEKWIKRRLSRHR